jgi:SAM-dependent methyltransferase
MKESVKTGVLAAGRTILRPRGVAFARSLTIRNLPSTGMYRDLLRGRIALEIGGPSEIFALGPLPVYRVLHSVDGCNYAARTLWEPAGFAPRYRRTFVAEASSLDSVEEGSYGCVLASHVLEHVANPLKACVEWHRVLADDGLLLMILPDKDRTFDRRRPVTTVEHMVGDYERGTGEDDLTHVEEILSLHDLSRDPWAGTIDQFRERSLNNAELRTLHHHVFTLESASELLAHADFTTVATERADPFHLIVLARRGVRDRPASTVTP